MILRFTFSNFRSFHTEQTLSLVPSKVRKSGQSAGSVADSTPAALRVCAIYGANASGKTTVARALEFMYTAVRDSHRVWAPGAGVPVTQFKIATGGESRFVLDFLVDKVRHQYGFSVTPERITHEWLMAFPNGKRQLWFERKDNPRASSFSRNMPGDNKTIANLTRENSLFLSSAAQNAHEALGPIYRWFSTSLNFVLSDRQAWEQAAVQACKEEVFRKTIAGLLTTADIGVVDIQQHTVPVDPLMSERATQLAEAVSKILGPPPDTTWAELTKPKATLRLVHKIGDSLIPFNSDEESNGTRAYLGLMGPVITCLFLGEVLVIDELDSSLHPLLAAQIVQIFNNPELNPRGAQLIFNTHDTNLLSVLARDQIWFTEKDGNGASSLYPLSDFKLRASDSIESGYLQGRFGAIPFPNARNILGGALESRGE